MRAAAKLLAEIADRHHADHVVILFAEEHRGPESPGLGQRQFDVADRLGRQNPVVHLVFNADQFLFADGRRVGKVEAEPILVDLRALL